MEIIKLKCQSAPKVEQVTIPHPLAKADRRYQFARELDHEYIVFEEARPVGISVGDVENIFRKQQLVVVEPSHDMKEGIRYKGYLKDFRANSGTVSLKLIIQ